MVGGDGDYFIDLGAGADTVKIDGNGSSTITAGSGDATISITGDGDNTIDVGTGTATVSLSGSGQCTLDFTGPNEKVDLASISGFIGKILVSGFAASDEIDFSQANLTTCATFDAENDSDYVNLGVPGELDVYAQTTKIATLVFGGLSAGSTVTDLEPLAGSTAGTGLILDPTSVAKANYEGATGLGQVHWDIIRQNEGNELEPYVPIAGHSGVTVGTGVDLANGMTQATFQKLFPNFTSDLNLVLLWGASGNGNSAGPKLQNAVNYLKSNGATLTISNSGSVQSISSSITPSQANVLANYAERTNFDQTVQQWSNASTGVSFYKLPWQVQTSLVDLHYNTGSIRTGHLINDVAAAYQLGTSSLTSSLTPVAWVLVEADLAATNLSKSRVAVDQGLINQLVTYKVIEGYISGATVFADANGTGQLASNDIWTTTDASGSFALTGGIGPLIAFGGTDTSTGLAFKGQLKAPSGATVIDPLTTLISGLQTAGATLAAAEEAVLTAFGLPSATDVTTLDPVASAEGGSAVGAQAYAAGSKVIDIADAIGSAFATSSEGFLGAFEAAFAGLESDIKTLAAGQTLNLTDEKTITALINSVAKTAGLDDASFVSALSTDIVDSNGAIDAKLAQDGASSSLITEVSNVQRAIQTVVVASTFDLTKGADSVNGGSGNDTIIAASTTLSSGDKIDGGGGSNTLALEGPGTFNIALPSILTNVQTITATEGQAAYSSGGHAYAAQNQIVVLRAGVNATVNVESDMNLNANDPKPATITIVGAANSAVINLASGNDVVTVGGPNETVNLGSGNDTINVTAATIGATIGNGTGHNTLNVTGGGAPAMGANISGIASVLLSSASTAYRFTANAISGLTVSDSSITTADVLTAGGVHQTLTGGGAGKVEFVGATAGDDTFKNLSTIFNGDTISGFGNNGDVIDLTDVSSTGLRPLSYVQTTATSGKLTVSDGTHTAAITLLGQYVANGFHPTSDGGVGTAFTYQPAAQITASSTSHHA